MKTSENREIKPSRISTPSPKPRKYLYVKIMAYTVFSVMYSIPIVAKSVLMFEYKSFLQLYHFIVFVLMQIE